MATSGEVKSSGEGELPGPADYPCVKRLRHRRLLSFLHDQGLHGTYNALTHETDAHFSLAHLQRLVKRGLWGHAVLYLNTYVPPNGQCFHAYIFHNFLRLHHGFAKAIAGYGNEFLVRNYVDRPGPLSAAELDLRATVLSILDSDPEKVRAAMDWERVRTKAVSVVHRLAHSTPELRCSLKLPAACITPHHVLPLGSSSSLLRQRHLINKKVPPQQKTRAIISALNRRSYIQVCRSSVIGTLERAKEVLFNYIDKTLKAGLREGCSLSVPIQPSGKEVQMNVKPGKSTDRCLVSSVEVLKNRPIGEHLEECPLMVSPYLKDKLNLCKKNAGKKSEQAASTDLDQLRSNKRLPTSVPHIRLSDGDVLGKITEKMRDLEEVYEEMGDLYSKMGIVVNELKDLITTTPAEFSTEHAGAESSQMMSGTFTDPAKSSRITCETNAGTNKHWSETDCYMERACQDFSPRKNPRDEPTTVEEDRDRKRNRTTGEFDEASLVSMMETGAVAHPSLSTLVNLSA